MAVCQGNPLSGSGGGDHSQVMIASSKVVSRPGGCHRCHCHLGGRCRRVIDAGGVVQAAVTVIVVIWVVVVILSPMMGCSGGRCHW